MAKRLESSILLLFLIYFISSQNDTSLTVATWPIGFAKVVCPPGEGPFDQADLSD